METEKNLKAEPSALIRWAILLFISLAMFGNYYVYDSISPLADLLAKQLNFTDSNIGLLQGIYSFPNIILVLVGGLIIDRIGSKKAVLIFTFLIFLGSVITAASGNIVTMVIGRLVFGMGAESMIVAITTIIAQWFKGRELSFAFGLNLTVARLGSFLALNSPTWGKSLYNYWQTPLLVTVGATVFAIIFILVYFAFDKYFGKAAVVKADSQDKVLISDIFKKPTPKLVGWSASAIILCFIILQFFCRVYFTENVFLHLVIFISILLITYLKFDSFPKSFWLISALCVTFYSAMFPFQTFAIKFFQDAHGTTRAVGGNLSSILTLAAMFFTPLFGLLADKIGKRSLLMMFGSLIIIPVYLMMAYKFGSPGVLGPNDYINLNFDFFDIHAAIPKYLILPMGMMGLAFSLVPAVMWPSVALVVKEEKLGTAYGLMTMIQNIGLFSFNVIIGFVNDLSKAGPDNPGGYNLGMWIFSTLGFFGMAFAYLLRRNEKGANGFGLEKGMK
jgi:MFS family permease